jgi:hypothetical protein
MATIIEKETGYTTDDPRVYHPLDRLRGIVRRYVVIEGILSAAIFIMCWYALAMILDFGVFKAFTWDWVQDGTRWIRIVALVLAIAFLAGIVIFRIVRRLTTELTYPALALVLERRFPNVLGDRLITAVELVDVEKAAEYGYSADMIRQTIAEARERVGTVAVNEVFNWRRLQLMALLAVGILLGVVVTAFASHAIATKSFQPVHAGWKLVHVSSILVERNLMIRNTPWPRRALLQLDPAIKETGIRIARDGPPPHVKVKSFRWVIADRKVPDGWRALVWSDVTKDKLGIEGPAIPFATLADEKGGPPPEADKWTLDDLWERAVENPVIRAKLNNEMSGDQFAALQATLDKLEEMANNPAWGRTLRHLDRPGSVAFEYSGVRTGGGGTLNPENSSEFSGEIGGLREDVTFVIKAEDYRTPQRAITLIPPPALVKLNQVQRKPAYLYYSPPLVPSPDQPNTMTRLGPASLKGKLQLMQEQKLSLTGDRSVFDVAAGTEVTITGVTELPIAEAFARPKVGKVPGGKPGSAALVPLKVIDENTFVIEFKGEDRLTSAVEFDLVFRNADKVESVRPVLIQVNEDQAPVVEVAPEYIRRIGNLYYVTPRAKIPFNPGSSARDDNGLSKVEYRVTHWQEDSPLNRTFRCGNIARSIVPPSLPGTSFPSVMLGAHHALAFRFLDKGDNKTTSSFIVRSFDELERKITPETLVHLDELLVQPLNPKADLVKEVGLKSSLRSEVTRNKTNNLIDTFKWQIEGDYFDVRALNLEAPYGDVQPRYMVELNIWATDSNYDTGPKAATHPEPIRLLVISSGDLLYEISKDEESLGLKLDDAIKKVEAARKKYEYVHSKNGIVGLDEIDAVKVRSKDAWQDLTKAQEAVQTVLREYRRIERECVYNQLDDKNIVYYGKLANMIDRVLGETPSPVSTDEDAALQRGDFAAVPNFPAIDKLLALVQGSLDEGRWADGPVVINTENQIRLMENELRKIRTLIGEGESFDKLKQGIAAVLEQQRRVKYDLIKYQDYLFGKLTKDTPDISEVGQVLLVKGESKKIQHKIDWRQYKDDFMSIKLASSDPEGVMVPEELKLEFEKNNFDFSYEIRAGNKAGDFTITLTPAAGPKLQVKVTVK